MDTEIRKKIASDFLDNSKLQMQLDNGYSRWLDEKEYEDIKNYSVLYSDLVKSIGGEFLQMTKRPFGFKFKLDVATYHFFIKSNNIGYSRVA